MPRYSVEYTFLVPHYVHEEIEAPNKAAAIAEAKRKLAEDDIDWDGQKKDYESSRPTEITGMWFGEEAYGGRPLDWEAK